MSTDNPTPDPVDSKSETSTPSVQDETASKDESKAPTHPTSPAKSKPRRRRRWPWIVGGLFLMLVLLVVLLPTIASMGFVRSFVVGQINKNLNGRVEIADWSLRWGSGQSITGVKVYDTNGALVIQLDSVRTELSLIDALQGRYELGNTPVTGLVANVRQFADGSINLAKLLKPSEPEPDKPTRVPYFSVNASLHNCRVTFDREATGPGDRPHSVQLTSIEGSVKVTDPNAPIHDQLTIKARVDGGPEGTLTLAGTVDLIENNVPDLRNGQATQTVTKKGIGLDALAAIVPNLGELKGTIDATTTFAYAGDKRVATLTTDVRGADVVIPLPNGDTFRADTLDLKVPGTTLDLSAGFNRPNAWEVRVGNSSQDHVLLEAKRGGKVIVATAIGVHAPLQALLNLAKNAPPAGTGQISIRPTADVGALAEMMPKTLALKEGLSLREGIFEARLDIALKPDQATIDAFAELSNVRGVDAQGKAIALQPLGATIKATTLGGGWAWPQLQHLMIAPKGPGISGTIAGASLTELSGKIDVVLEQMQADLSQLFDFKGISLAGRVELALNEGRQTAAGTALPTRPAIAAAPATQPGQATPFSLAVRGTDLRIQRPNEQPYSQERVAINLATDVVRNAEGGVDHLKNARMTADIGPDNARIFTAAVSIPRVEFVKSGTATKVVANQIDIQKIAFPLARMMQELRPFVPALDAWRVQQGDYTMSGKASFDGETLTATLNGTLANVTAGRVTPTGPVPLVNGETLQIAIDLTASAQHVHIAKTEITGQLLTAKVTGDIHLKTPTGGPVALAKGLKSLHVEFGGDVAKWQPIFDAFGVKQPVVQADQLRPGSDSPELAAIAFVASPALLAAQVAEPPGTIGRPRDPAAAPRPAESPATPSAETRPPVRFVRGAVSVTLDITGDGSKLTLAQTATVKGLAFTAGTVTHEVGDVTLNGNAVAALAPNAPADAAMLQQLAEVRVDKLTATGVGTTVNLKEPAIVRDPAQLPAVLASLAATQPATQPAGPMPEMKLALGATGQLAPLIDLLDALGGQQPQRKVSGQFELTETLSTSPGGALRAEGRLDLKDLAIVDPASGDAFREPLVTVANNISFDRRADSLVIDQFRLAMEQTQSLVFDLKGRIAQFSTARRFEGPGEGGAMVGTLTYELAKLWPAIRPLMTPAPDPADPSKMREIIADAKMAGAHSQQIAISGSYPAGLPFNQAIRSLTARGGSVEFNLIEMAGLTLMPVGNVKSVTIPWTLRDGIFEFADRGADGQLRRLPTAIAANSGRIRLANNDGVLAIDLTGDHPRLSGPAGLKVLDGVALNKVMSSFMGGMFSNPLFMNPEQAVGVVHLTIEQLDRLPLGSQVTEFSSRNDGKAVLMLTIDEVQLSSPISGALATGLRAVGAASPEFLDQFRGSVKHYRITINRGITSHDLILALGEQQRELRLYGNVKMATRELMPLNIHLTANLLGGRLEKTLPRGLEVPLRGTLTDWHLDILGAVRNHILGATGLPIGPEGLNPQGIADLINRAAGGDRPAPPRPGGIVPQPATQPGAQPAQPADPFNIFGDLLEKKRREEQEKKEKERQERERRERGPRG